MKQRDIVLVPFPFSDQSGRKVRPALILSNNTFNKSSNDLIICAITTALRPSKYSLIIDQTNIGSGNLYETSAIKGETILKIQKSLVIKTIATVNKSTFSKVVALISKLVRPS